jgi:hypothetical protein
VELELDAGSDDDELQAEDEGDLRLSDEAVDVDADVGSGDNIDDYEDALHAGDEEEDLMDDGEEEEEEDGSEHPRSPWRNRVR